MAISKLHADADKLGQFLLYPQLAEQVVLKLTSPIIKLPDQRILTIITWQIFEIAEDLFADFIWQIRKEGKLRHAL